MVRRLVLFPRPVSVSCLHNAHTSALTRHTKLGHDRIGS